MTMYDKAFKALERAGFSPDMMGGPDDPHIFVNVWTDDLGQSHEMRLHDTEIGWWASKHEKELVD